MRRSPLVFLPVALATQFHARPQFHSSLDTPRLGSALVPTVKTGGTEHYEFLVCFYEVPTSWVFGFISWRFF